MFRALLSCLPNAVLQSHPYKYGHVHIIRYIPGFLPSFHSDFARIFAKNRQIFFTKMSSDEELVTQEITGTTLCTHCTLMHSYGVLVQYVLLYCDLCDFVNILSRFTLFCSDLRCFVVIYVVLLRFTLFCCNLRCYVATT